MSLALKLAMVGALCLPLLISRSSQASFEAPSISTVNIIPTTFYGVWGNARHARLPTGNNLANDPTGDEENFYDIWAVGADTRGLAGGWPWLDKGSIYHFDGTQWSNVESDSDNNFDGQNQPTTFYSVVGQAPPGNGNAEIWFGGEADARDGCSTIHFFDTNEHLERVPETWRNLYRARVRDLNKLDCTQAGHNVNLDSDVYAMAADQNFVTGIVAGGANGMLYSHSVYYVAGTTKDTWDQISFPNTQNITGLAYALNRTAYAVGTTATTTDINGKHHLDRDCTNSGSQTSGLYKISGGVVFSLKSLSGACFYGLTVGNLPSIRPDHSANYVTIWIASSKGVYRYDEGSNTLTGPLSGTSGTVLRSITSVEQQGGTGQNLLRNPDFESWDSDPSNAATDLPNDNATTWLASDSFFGTNNSAGNCLDAVNNKNSKDVIVEGGSSNVDHGTYALKVAPAVYYNSQSNCNTNTNPQYTGFDAVFQTVPLTNWEGRKIHVTGKYKVQFTGAASAPHPQGGVSILCPTGGYSDPQDEPDCSYENRSAIRTANQGNTTGDPKADGKGFLTFDYTISVNNTQFFPRILGGTKSPRPTDAGMVLQIQCEGTYGAQVWCDDLHVEAVDEPALPAYDRFVVTAVGEAGNIMSTSDGRAVGIGGGDANAFIVERDDATSTDRLNGVWAVDPQHTYAVGQNSIIAQHRSGNVTGGIWVGTASPVSSGNATLGWISSNCANQRDASGSSLCTRSPDTFGLDFQNNQLSGRAWFGKQYTSATHEDQEATSLGSCQGTALLAGRPNTYSMTGACDRTNRWCFSDHNHACNRDFDCYGRCQKDQGVVCAVDLDCEGKTDLPVGTQTPQATSTKLSSPPALRQVCGSNNGSPQACTGLGWLSFNQADTGATPGSSCASNVDTCYRLQNNGDIIDGWGQFLTMANPNDPNQDIPNSWVHLRGADVCGGTSGTACASTAPNYGYYNCQNCTGALSCSFCQDNQQHSCLSGTNCTYYCQGTAQPCTTDAVCGSGKSCGPKSVCSLDQTTICSGDPDCTGGKGRCVQGAACQQVSSCSQYGVNFNPQRQQFSGYAWSSALGWLDFSFLQVGNPPYLQTRLGDIYAKGRVGNSLTIPAPGGLCNATYLISAGNSITSFCSVQGAAGLQSQAPTIPSGGPTNSYTNVLGRLDVTGLEKDVGGGRNKFGTPIVALAPDVTNDISYSFPDYGPDTLGGNHIPLNGKIFTVGTGGSDTITINQLLRFLPGTTSPISSGAGVLIVNGNLRVNNQLTYHSDSVSTISDLRSLASFVVIVKGNLFIDQTVTNMVGTYYVLGTVCTAPGSQASCTYVSNGSQYPLTIRGLLIAKAFGFNRTYAGTIDNPSPSELIIFDGRFQSNPLPGMTDFASALPNTSGANQ